MKIITGASKSPIPPLSKNDFFIMDRLKRVTPNNYVNISFFIIFLFAIFFEKVGLKIGSIEVSSVQLCVSFIVTFFLYKNYLEFNIIRFFLFSIFLILSIISQILSKSNSSALSYLFLISLYAPLLFSIKLEQYELKKVFGNFQYLMIFSSGMIFIQLIWQILLHKPALSIEPLIPNSFKMTGYMYTAPIHWGEPLMRPNGFFFLEPSFASAFCAISVIIEISIFRRPWRLAWYGAALLLSTGATGLVLATAGGIALFTRQRPILSLSVISAGLIGVLTVLMMGSGTDYFGGRFAELGNQESSGFGRLVAPLLQLKDVSSDPHYLFTGAGAGNINQASDLTSSAWPIVKLYIEYGLLSTIAFLAFIIYCFMGSPLPPLAFAIFCVYNFTGGYLLSPMLPIMIFMFATALRSNLGAMPDSPNR